MNYRYLLFDWDGTLSQTLPVWKSSLVDALKLHGYQVDDREIQADYRQFELTAQVLGINTDDVQHILTTARELIKQSERHIPPYTDTVSSLRRFHAMGARIAIVTTSTHRQVDHKLEAWDIDKFVDVVICREDVKERASRTQSPCCLRYKSLAHFRTRLQ